MIWGALDMYADEHGRNTPQTLEELVPAHLPELTRDPFATEQTAAEKETHGARPSLDGWGFATAAERKATPPGASPAWDCPISPSAPKRET